MKSSHATLFVLVVFLSGSGLAQQSAFPIADQPLSSNSATLQEETPAQQSISAAQLQIKSDPKKVQAYNELALAFLRRTRETADPKYLKDADAALAQGLKLDPEDFQLQRTQVALMLGRHEFAQAKERATVLHRRTAGRCYDLWIYRRSRHRARQLSRGRDECAVDVEFAAQQYSGAPDRSRTANAVWRPARRNRVPEPGVLGDFADSRSKTWRGLQTRSRRFRSTRARLTRQRRLLRRPSSSFTLIPTRWRIWRAFAWPRIERAMRFNY